MYAFTTTATLLVQSNTLTASIRGSKSLIYPDRLIGGKAVASLFSGLMNNIGLPRENILTS